MTRQEAVEFLPIIKAYSEGKIIQFRAFNIDKWDDLSTNLSFGNIPDKYRIKEDPALIQFNVGDYDLFKDKWIRKKGDTAIFNVYRIVRVDYNSISVIEDSGVVLYVTYYAMLTKWTFEDGTPCGKLSTEEDL